MTQDVIGLRRSSMIWAIGPIVAALSFMVAPFAMAGQLNLIISDVDIRFDGASGLIYDNPNQAMGNLDPNESDDVAVTIIEVNGVVTDTLLPSDTDLSTDVLVSGLPGELDLNTFSQQTLATTGFGLDWFTGAGDFLRLSIGSVDVLLTDGFFLLSTQAAIVDQLLPNGLQIAGPVQVAFIATLPTIQVGQGGAMDVIASGALTISATLVPEPTAAILLATTGAIFWLGRRRS